jgi:glycosyltransferase involved in cell wall biosynthesis
MGLIERLAAHRVFPVEDRALNVSFETQAPDGPLRPGERGVKGGPAEAEPKVSCLLVTTGTRAVLACAMACYAAQTWPNRELVVVTDADGQAGVARAIAASGAEDVRVHVVGREMTLGDCRNVATARAAGQIVMQWDDDDLSDPLRISAAVALLRGSDAAAAFLERVVVWQPARRRAAISQRRLWEGSIAVWRDHAPVYPSLARGEDTPAVEQLSTTRAIATYEGALLYVYIIHSQNTWDAAHFDDIFRDAEDVFVGADYAALIEQLAGRIPVRRYLAALGTGDPAVDAVFADSGVLEADPA